MTGEPRIWSQITDTLPDGHSLAGRTLYCQRCEQMVHASNNENMQTWVETGHGPHCLMCFAVIERAVDLEAEGWGLGDPRGG